MTAGQTCPGHREEATLRIMRGLFVSDPVLSAIYVVRPGMLI